jgi:cytoskeletal protein CcmA (bactofilin family)
LRNITLGGSVMKNTIAKAFLLLALLLLFATPAMAQNGDSGGDVHLGQDLRLGVDQVVTGDTVIMGGDLVMEQGSRIEGDVVVFGGRAIVDGEVTGDLVVIGGDIQLKSHAIAKDNVVAISGTLTRDEGAVVHGETVQTDMFRFKDMARAFPEGFHPGPPEGPPRSGFDLLSVLLHIVRALTLAVVLGVIGLLVVLLLPAHIEVVTNTILDAIWTSLGVGLLTLVVAISVILFLTVTICLLPIGLLLGLALLVASLFGWVVIGYILGKRLAPILYKREIVPPILSALVGVFLLTLLQQGLMVLSDIPCLGVLFWLLGAGVWLIAVSTGLGAVVLSRFGTHRYIVLHPRREAPQALPPQAQLGATETDETPESTDASLPEVDNERGPATPSD